MEKDLMQICRNACTFNEPGSQIYKYAKTLKKVISSKKYEIEHGRPGASSSTPGKSERIRNRKLRSGISHSAATAALQYEDDEEEEEDVEEVEGESEDEGNILNTIYNRVSGLIKTF
jgi:protein polybromo-1